jgi:hypothetical protein
VYSYITFCATGSKLRFSLDKKALRRAAKQPSAAVPWSYPFATMTTTTSTITSSSSRSSGDISSVYTLNSSGGSNVTIIHPSSAVSVVGDEDAPPITEEVLNRFADEGYRYLGRVQLSGAMFRKESTLADAGISLADAVDRGRNMAVVSSKMETECIRATSDGHIYIVQ